MTRSAVPARGLFLDFAIANHELAHSVIQHSEGWILEAVITNRHRLDGDHLGLAVAKIPGEATIEAQARSILAGNVEGSIHSEKDERRALELWVSVGGPRGWIEAREREVDEVLRRQARAFGAGVDLAIDRGGIVAGDVLQPVFAELWVSD